MPLFTLSYSFLSAIVVLLIASSTSDAFVLPSTSQAAKAVGSSRLSALPADFPHFIISDEVLSQAVETARQKFWFYFVLGNGAFGIGAAQLPSMFREAGVARSSAGKGTSLGGSPLNAGPLIGLYYDNEISANDVADVIEKAPTAEYISSRSESLNYMASKGYIEQRDFIKELEQKNCNPLASYVVFDAISSGKGGVVSPVVYEDKLSTYREGGGDLASFVSDLNAFLATKVFAFFGLVFCLLVDVGFVAKNGIEGFLS